MWEEISLKEILKDKTALILEGISVAAVIVYILFTGSYAKTPVFLSWLFAMAGFLAALIHSAVKKRWILTAVNLAALILVFMSIVIMPYEIK